MRGFDSRSGLLNSVRIILFMPKTVLNIIIIIVITFIALTFSKTASAQGFTSPDERGTGSTSFTAQKSFDDYKYQQSLYENSRDGYIEAKTFYKKNPTLQLQEEARLKTLEMLKNRDQITIVYLTALRMQIVESTGFTAEEKGAIYSKLDPEVAWYQTHLETYTDGDDLNTLFTRSDECKSRYQSNTRYVVYESLFDISLSSAIGLRMDHQVVYADLKNFVNDQVSTGKVTLDPFNRWLNATDAVLNALNQNELAAQKKMQSAFTQNLPINTVYNSAVSIMKNLVTLQAQLNNYLSELLTTADTLAQP
jgi:hypothetical protein